MNAGKKKSLEKNGFTVGSVTQFLGLTKEKSTFIEIRLAPTEVKKLKSSRKAYEGDLPGFD